MKRELIALFLLINLLRPSTAQDLARIVAMDRAQAQFSVCEAYYKIEGDCSNDENSARKLEIIAKRSGEAAKAAAMDKEDVAVRLQLNLLIQKSLIQDDCGSVATLQNRYGVECDPLAAE